MLYEENEKPKSVALILELALNPANAEALSENGTFPPPILGHGESFRSADGRSGEGLPRGLAQELRSGDQHRQHLLPVLSEHSTAAGDIALQGRYLRISVKVFNSD